MTTLDDDRKPVCDLTGEPRDGFFVIGRVCRVLRAAGREDQVDEFVGRAMDLGYEGVVTIAKHYVEIR